MQYNQKFHYICSVKQTLVILLLSLLLFPIIWNGVSLIHYAVEHTHTFCQTEAEHSHPNPDNCLSVFELSDNQNKSQLPTNTKSDFQEIQQYLSPNLAFNSTLLLSLQQINFVNPSLPDNFFLKDVFLPPIFA